MNDKKLLFVSGTPRSGTSALVSLLNFHPSLMIGMERYHGQYKKNCLDCSFFERDRFLDIRDGDTHSKGGFRNHDSANLIHTYDKSEIIGDKYPLMYLHFSHILPTFPDAKHAFIIRNPLSVAESYQKRFVNPDDSFKFDFRTAVQHWNNGVNIINSLPDSIRNNFIVLQYETIFVSDTEIERFFAFLNLSPPPQKSVEILRKRSHNITMENSFIRSEEEIYVHVARNADYNTANKLLTTAGLPYLENT